MTDITSYLDQAANYYSIPPSLFENQLAQESGTPFEPNTVGSNLGTIGNVGQITQPALTDINNLWGTNYSESDLASNPSLAIQGAAAYDSILYGQSGSYEDMLQSYGTVPSNPLNATTTQNQLSEIAQNLDIFGSSQAGAPVQNPNAPGAGLGQAANNISQSSFWNFITSGAGWERVGVIVIGILLLGVAGFMLATKGFEGTVRTVAKAT